MVARYEQIAAWANEYGWTRGAELGVFDGRTHLYLLENCPQLHLIGVDVWDMPGFMEGPTKSGERCFCQYCSETRASRKARTIGQMKADVVDAIRPFGRSKICIGETRAMACEIPDVTLDFVFVDADHSTEGVAADVGAWWPKVRFGGRLIGHDWNLKSVRDGVIQHFSNIETGDDHLWWVRL